MEWFESWFESPYYHTLYKNRSDEEAQQFIDRLISHLQLPHNSSVLDLACGKGRHSKYLHQKGFRVTGADLSSYNIEQASKMAQEGLEFIRHDMRETIANNTFTAVFNLFTSFGYFDDTNDNILVLKAVNEELINNGIFVIDFLNPIYVANRMVKEETKTIDGVDFLIKKSIDNGFIYKSIQITDSAKHYSYQERVQAITQKELVEMLEQTGFQLVDCFGEYDLSPFQAEKSSRSILVAQKA